MFFVVRGTDGWDEVHIDNGVYGAASQRLRKLQNPRSGHSLEAFALVCSCFVQVQEEVGVFRALLNISEMLYKRTQFGSAIILLSLGSQMRCVRSLMFRASRRALRKDKASSVDI